MKTKLDLKQIRDEAEWLSPRAQEIIESLCEEIEELEPYPDPAELLAASGGRILQLEKEIKELREMDENKINKVLDR